MKKIALLTSGGDAPGMNAAIRSVVRRGISKGLEVYGIHRGYQGLIERDCEALSAASVAGIIQRGGTILRTARSEDFRSSEGRKVAADNLKMLGIDGLIVIGGDGSLKGAETLSKEFGVSTMVIPGTIDNDMAGTDYTIGFDTALNNILDGVNKIRDTANSHQRVAIIEVMGRNSGQLALMAGLSCGAEIILVPEFEWSYEEVCHQIYESHQKGKLYSIIIVAEGAAKGVDVGNKILRRTGADVNVTVLGYLQRGGSPTAIDNIAGTRLGARAVDELLGGNRDCLVGMKNGEVTCIPYEDTYKLKHDLKLALYDLAAGLSR